METARHAAELRNPSPRLTLPAFLSLMRPNPVTQPRGFPMRALLLGSFTAAAVLAVIGNPLQAAQPAATANAEINLTSYANGAWLLNKPAEYDEEWSAFRLLDERSDTGWATPDGVVTPQQATIVLPEQSIVGTIEFDSANTDGDPEGSRSAKDILVEMSDQGPNSGFETIASVALKPKLDKQRFSIAKPVAGRWIRLTVKTNHGSAEYIELFDFRAYGEQKTHTAAPNVSGTYSTNYGNFHLQQDGAAVSGCYEDDGGLVTNGGIEGRVTRFTWVQTKSRGPAIFTFSPDGRQMLGLWWNEGQTDGPGGLWYGKRISDKVGSCPHWQGAQTASVQLAQDIGETGRARIYGINFDTDSDVIKPESRTALDNIVKLAKDKPDWKFTIEGHTDSTASAAHNQQLSEKRAASVKAYLVAAGVAADRLTAKGFGATRPVADNGTAIGRAQNRRVELVKD
jgi:outer membrane protein OmpA-like peptidoglycan-associated protein